MSSTAACLSFRVLFSVPNLFGLSKYAGHRRQKGWQASRDQKACISQCNRSNRSKLRHSALYSRYALLSALFPASRRTGSSILDGPLLPTRRWSRRSRAVSAGHGGPFTGKQSDVRPVVRRPLTKVHLLQAESDGDVPVRVRFVEPDGGRLHQTLNGAHRLLLTRCIYTGAKVKRTDRPLSYAEIPLRLRGDHPGHRPWASGGCASR